MKKALMTGERGNPTRLYQTFQLSSFLYLHNGDDVDDDDDDSDDGDDDSDDDDECLQQWESLHVIRNQSNAVNHIILAKTPLMLQWDFDGNPPGCS